MTQLPDLCWLKGTQTKYVCPILATVSLWLWRLRGKSAHWYQGNGSAGVYFDAGRSKWEARCLFPRKLIHAECDFWNRRIQRGKWHPFKR